MTTASQTPSLSLTGKKVVVVGGKTGIGLGIARAALAAGATVVVASRRITSVEARPELAGFEQASLDMRDEAAVRSAFAAIGPFDHLVVTAAPDIGTWGGFMEPTWAACAAMWKASSSAPGPAPATPRRCCARAVR
ncbi:SDR family NAD(P)-dependent oxidoreductase [uncultured Herbaspirillum sp.]|uniref:SDR family NAD(P)-dependent oxidoreductase n=1 Tax=uncultured Herbaspirillum sp. TaxID=160236 RepID=UPI00258D4301|nr:SDR family NAD(P)-dependent oxidoreductase [uncultured Herbaspirillum sp.]